MSMPVRVFLCSERSYKRPMALAKEILKSYADGARSSQSFRRDRAPRRPHGKRCANCASMSLT